MQVRTKAEIAAARPIVEIDTPELGRVRLRGSRFAALLALTTASEDPQQRADAAVGQIAISVVDELGETVYDTPEGRDALRELSAKTTMQLTAEIARLNVFTQEAQGAVVKN